MADSQEQTRKDFKEECFDERASIEEIKMNVQLIRGHPDFDAEETVLNRLSEMKANLQLAYRHLEDARMRLGKAVQAYDGGTSCYPR